MGAGILLFEYRRQGEKEEVKQAEIEQEKRDLRDQGGKYLVFVSSRSVKMRGFSFLSLYKSLFIFQFLNVKMYNYSKQNIIVNFIIQKLKNKHTFLKKHAN